MPLKKDVTESSLPGNETIVNLEEGNDIDPERFGQNFKNENRDAFILIVDLILLALVLMVIFKYRKDIATFYKKT